jgi:hypothetical protein
VRSHHRCLLQGLIEPQHNEFSRDVTFAFISNRSFFIASVTDHVCISLFAIQAPDSFTEGIWSVTVLPVLHFPEVCEGWRMGYVSVHIASHSAGSCGRGLFRGDPSARIYVLDLSGHLGSQKTEAYRCFIHQRTFMKYITESLDCYRISIGGHSESSNHAVHVPWSEWGPTGTRFHESPGNHYFMG